MLRVLHLSCLGVLGASAVADDLPVVGFGGTGSGYGESGDLIRGEGLVVTRDSGVGETRVRVRFPGTGGATSGQDYEGDELEIIFGDGELSKPVPLAILQDQTAEAVEEVDLSLEVISGGTAGVATSSIQLFDDDQAVVRIDDVTAVEGVRGATEMVFTVTLDGAVDAPVTVHWETEQGTAKPPDFLFAGGSVSFSGSAGEARTLAVRMLGDELVELDETFFVRLVSVSAGGRNVVIPDDRGVGTIVNDDQAVITITADGDVVEGDDGTPRMVFRAAMDKEVDVPVTGIFGVTATATPNVDYRVPDGGAVVVSTEGAEFGIEIIPDNLAELDEWIFASFQRRRVEAGGRDVVLRNGVSGVLLMHAIRDDDAVPVAVPEPPYAGVGNRTLRVDAANGVLANDTDGDDGDGPGHLTAVLEVGPSHGQLDLQPDGGFDYTPDLGFVGTDSFRYAASDRTNRSAAQDVRIEVARPIVLAVSSEPPVLDRQSGRFVARVSVTNPNREAVAAFRLYADALPPGVRVYNAQGAGEFGSPPVVLPYLRYDRPLASGESVVLSVEFFAAARDPGLGFEPDYRVEPLAQPGSVPDAAPAGIPVTRNVRLPSGDHLVEIASRPGSSYAVEYSGDMANWVRIEPPVVAVADRLQWIDRGPPQTVGHPSTVPVRFYRFVPLDGDP